MRRIRRSATSLVLSWILVLGVCLSPGRSSAQAPEASGDDGSEKDASLSARQHYRKGAKAFRAGDTESALHHFRRAYELKPDGMLLYNLALVQTAAGRPEKALWYAKQARKTGDLTDNAEVRNDARLRGLNVTMTSRSLTKRAAPADDESKVAATPESPPPQPSPTEEPNSPLPPDSASPAAPPSDRPVFWGGVSVAGLGLAGLGGAAIVELTLRDEVSAYRSAAENARQQRYRQLETTIERRQKFGRALLFGGAIATGLGAAVATVDLTNRGAPAPFRLTASPATGARPGLLVTLTTDF